MIEIKFELENKKAVAYDEGKEIGKLTFSVNGNVWSIEHTFVDKNYGGQGIAKKLVKITVDEAKKRDIKIIPVCSYVKKEFEKNDEYKEVEY